MNDKKPIIINSNKLRIFSFKEFLKMIIEIKPTAVLDFLVYYEAKKSNTRLKKAYYNSEKPMESEIEIPIFSANPKGIWGIMSISDYIRYFNHNYIAEDNLPLAKDILLNKCNFTEDEWSVIELRYKL